MSRLSTSSPATRVLGATAAGSMVVVCVLGLWVTPPDRIQGDAVRILYIHPPTIWVAYFGFALAALCSLLYLIPRTRDLKWDRLAGASAEVGVVFTGLCLVTGAMWGRITWGVYWQWDARLTTTLLLFVLYLGYLALRRVPAPSDVRARRSAIAALIAFVDVPVTYKSVEWWRTLHQEASLDLEGFEFEIEGEMLQALLFSIVAFTLVFAWAVLHRVRLARLDEQLEDELLAAAIEERRESRLVARPGGGA